MMRKQRIKPLWFIYLSLVLAVGCTQLDLPGDSQIEADIATKEGITEPALGSKNSADAETGIESEDETESETDTKTPVTRPEPTPTPPPTAVAIKPDAFPVSLFVGDDGVPVSASIIMSDESLQEEGLVWTVDNVGVAKIENGKLYPLAEGSAKITISAAENADILKDIYVRVRPADEKNVVVGVAPTEDGSLPTSTTTTVSSGTTGGTSVSTISNGGLTSFVTLVGKLTDMESHGDHLFVTNQTTNMVHVISISTGQMVKEIPVSSVPIDMVLSPNGSKLYVGSNGAAVVDEIDTNTLEKLRTIDVGNTVFRMAVNDTHLIVSYDAFSADIEMYDLAGGTLAATLPTEVDGHSFMLLSSDKSTLYVLGRYFGDIHKVDVSTTPPALIETVDTNTYTDDDIVFNHDESEILVPSYASSTEGIQALRTSDLKPAGIYPLDTYDANSADVTPDGNYVLATHYDNKVVIFNRETRAEITEVTSGFTRYRHFERIHLAADGQSIFGFIEAANYQDLQLVNPGRMDKIKLD